MKYMHWFINERESIGTFCVYLDGKIQDIGDSFSFVFYWFVEKLRNVSAFLLQSETKKKIIEKALPNDQTENIKENLAQDGGLYTGFSFSSLISL